LTGVFRFTPPFVQAGTKQTSDQYLKGNKFGFEALEILRAL